MILIKRIVLILSLVGLLNACNFQTNNTTGNVANCPKPAASLPKETLQVKTPKRTYIYDRFDYRPHQITTDADTVKLQARQYDFVFCRANQTWTVQPGSLKDQIIPSSPTAGMDLANPKLETINVGGKTYQYRVILDPNPFSVDRPRPEAEKVIFELISPNNARIEQTLYTLKDVRQADIGLKLGVPRITAVTMHSDRVWWAVSSEQGEGFNGMATLVGYNPQTDKLSMIQPEKIQGQQITDLVIAGDAANPTFWMGTMLAGEGNPFLPGLGLVAYRPDSQNPNSGSLKSYNVHNSPIVGAIPHKLKLEGDRLWVGTRNGACQLKWQAADKPKSWLCWRFAPMAQLPTEGVSLYSGLTDKTAVLTLSPDKTEKTVEVLWWMPVNLQTREGRYEVRHSQGFTFAQNNRGVYVFSPEVAARRAKLQPEPFPFSWAGEEWHWNGSRFVRGLDEVAKNEFGGGSRGIGSDSTAASGQVNWKAIRGDLDLLNLSQTSTSVKYYSGWVDDEKLNPYPSVVPQERPKRPKPNPLEAIAKLVSAE